MGKDILRNLIQATGISEELISSEIKLLTDRAGIQEQDITIEDLRLILAEYVQEVLLSAKEQFKALESSEKNEMPKDFTPRFPLDV